jgi:hypothetical protein
MGLVLLIVGIILALFGGIGILVAAFRESVGRGLGRMLLPIVSLIFVFLHWEEAKKPFLISVAGNVLLWGGHCDVQRVALKIDARSAEVRK